MGRNEIKAPFRDFIHNFSTKPWLEYIHTKLMFKGALPKQHNVLHKPGTSHKATFKLAQNSKHELIKKCIPLI